jgi:hypothetical protein
LLPLWLSYSLYIQSQVGDSSKAYKLITVYTQSPIRDRALLCDIAPYPFEKQNQVLNTVHDGAKNVPDSGAKQRKNNDNYDCN